MFARIQIYSGILIQPLKNEKTQRFKELRIYNLKSDKRGQSK